MVDKVFLIVLEVLYNAIYLEKSKGCAKQKLLDERQILSFTILILLLLLLLLLLFYNNAYIEI